MLRANAARVSGGDQPRQQHDNEAERRQRN
jgi:hypothetical protein